MEPYDLEEEHHDGLGQPQWVHLYHYMYELVLQDTVYTQEITQQ